MPVPSADDRDGYDEASGPRGSPYAADAVGTVSFLLNLRGKGVNDTRLLRAFEKVPRETFAPRRYADLARRDVALPLPCGQTMTAPFALARMIAALGVEAHHRVLEIGTGSGYSAAVLAGLGAEVVSLERWRTLVIEAEAKLAAHGFGAVGVLHADGLARRALGVFDRILVDGRVEAWPAAFFEWLAPGGRLVGVRGGATGAVLVAMTKHGDVAKPEALGAFAAPPLIPGIGVAL